MTNEKEEIALVQKIFEKSIEKKKNTHLVKTQPVCCRNEFLPVFFLQDRTCSKHFLLLSVLFICTYKVACESVGRFVC